MAPTLEELASVRHEIQQFCRRRDDSIWAFYDATAGWFKLAVDDPTPSRGDDEDNEAAADKVVAHLTTTVTSLEALAEAPLTDKQIEAIQGADRGNVSVPTLDEINDLDDLDHADDEGNEVRLVVRHRAVARRYIDLALQNPQDWRSDGAAYVYCRVRTLGAASRLLKEKDPAFTNNRDNLRKLLEQAWRSHRNAPLGVCENQRRTQIASIASMS